MRRFTDFLDADNQHGILANRIKEMVTPPDQATLTADEMPKRLVVSIDDLRDFDPELTAQLLVRPVEFLPVFERAMQDLITGIRQELTLDKRKLAEYRIGLQGSFGSRRVSPRGLKANLVGGVVNVEGIVTRASVVRPRLVLSVHYCPITKKFHEKTYRDNASVSSLAVFTQNSGMPGSSYPTKDEEGNPLETEFGKCWYRDSQRITIQELPETSPPGQLPRSVDVLIEGDLCDICKPGDRVSISGIFRAVGGAVAAGSSGLFSTFVVANHITLLSGAEGRVTVDASINEGDIMNFRDYAKKGNVLNRMSKSIAPSICGHDYIKKALLLLLIGGKERNLENGTHLRGDLNILMVGDPSTAKSQLLRFIMNTAPLAVSTTGRGSSGVGLTAAVTSDKDTGDRHLEAGAMVLADRGVVCIDEFDKMSDEDRVAIHEVMEQQTVTIAKAGIHASLNARCSVVAAANPVYGSYDKTRMPNENIALPDSLLSRFDLLFIVLDVTDKERDRQIADHVLRGHRFRRTTETLDDATDGPVRGRNTGANLADHSSEPAPVYESAASALYAPSSGSGRRRSRRQANKSENRILSSKFLKLYISYVKHRMNPVLTEDAAELIAKMYQSLRQDEYSKTQHITARSLETLIRLATAHAKLRLEKQKVGTEDVRAAAEVLRFALFNQAEPDKSERVFRRSQRSRRSKRNKGQNEDSDDSDSSDSDDGDGDDGEELAINGQSTSENPETGETNPEEDEDEITPAPSSRRNSRRSRHSGAANGGSSKRASATGSSLPESAQAEGGSQIDEEGANEATDDVGRVKIGLNKLRGRDSTVKLPSLISLLTSGEHGAPMTEEAVRQALDKLQERDVVVIADESIFIV
ncbi:Mini-chromosome maintenance protein [Gracilaria domingensis]|nr:Mini-chromosome maintenance protein [Gracilaria domingensis]